MKIWIPKSEDGKIGGGWTFLRNFRRGIAGKVEITEDIRLADIVFIPGVTLVERDDIELAARMGKKIVFRADNVPKKSRNKRGRVYDNMKRYGELADMVVFQSEWAADYCMPMFSANAELPHMVIYNGVDPEIFYRPVEKPDHPIYLFAYHGKNEVKGWPLAQYLFQRYHRQNPKSEFWFIYNFKSELQEQIESNYDFWNGEKFKHINLLQKPEDMADLLRQCTHLIYPAFADAAPNMVLEARACGLEVVGTLDPAWSGVSEMLNPSLDISLDRMCNEYLSLFTLLKEDYKEIQFGR